MAVSWKACADCGEMFFREKRVGLRLFEGRQFCGNLCASTARRKAIYLGGVECVLGAKRYRARGLRRAYEDFIGPIPAGYELDHLCRTPRCTNLRHIEAVPRPENWRRFVSSRAHCRYGHEFTPENTYWRPLGRECRQCWERRRHGA